MTLSFGPATAQNPDCYSSTPRGDGKTGTGDCIGTTPPGTGLGKGCPNPDCCPRPDPGLASRDLWGAGTLPFGEWRNGIHPRCGALRCKGGDTTRNIPRKCEWL